MARQQAIKTFLVGGHRRRKSPASRPDLPAGEQDLALCEDPTPAAKDFT
jgi:hypothetical protein